MGATVSRAFSSIIVLMNAWALGSIWTERPHWVEGTREPDFQLPLCAVRAMNPGPGAYGEGKVSAVIVYG
jgi:hypothetical protein